MSRLPMLDFRKVDKVLHYLGFEQTRQKGSHIFYRHPDGRTTTVPFHKSRDITRPLLREILREVETDPDELERILSEI
jgi:predicted RNA binding protein YcfA (HicA-like mRNA interferase family)